MKIPVPQNLNPIEILRKSGYGLVRDRRNSKQSFSRILGSGIYPRFHVYINSGNIINLHLDQKQASYQGSHAHSGEYDGEIVEAEAERIKGFIDSLSHSSQEPAKEEKERGFWGKLFG